MKLVNFTRGSDSATLERETGPEALGATHCGCVVAEECLDLTSAAAASALRLPAAVTSVDDLLRMDGGLQRVREQLSDGGGIPAALRPFALPLATARLAAPVLHPQKVIGIGFNYRDHAEETDTPLPGEPLFFAMFASAVSGPFDPIVRPASVAMLDYEAELAIVIGEPGRHIPVEKALDHVAGYTAFNDVSARNFQQSDSQWLRVKSFDSFAPMGPCLVTRDEVGDGSGLGIECRVNGEVRQRSNTRHLIFDVPYLVAYLSRVMTLLPGDVISTGTPAGVGFARRPQVFLQGGDVVEVEIERVGIIRNTVVDAGV